MSRADRNVCLTLQALILGMPLLLGGRHSWALPFAYPAVLALLVATLRERRRLGEYSAMPGVAALAAFVVLGMATTVALPPGLLRVVAPAAARLYGDMLPGWPEGGGWTVGRAVALDPYGVWLELGRLSLSFAVFAVIVAYPWRAVEVGEAPRERVFARLVLTLIAGGAALSGLALVQEVAGNARVLWISDAPRQSGRASGPFVNPNHFAAWLEMVIPVALAYGVALAARLHRRIGEAASTGRGMGVRPRRAWIAALIVNQRRLWPPLLASAAVVLMAVAHLASGSRAGTAALLVGLAVAVGGMVASVETSREGGARRWLPAALALGLVAAGVAAIALWAAAEGADQGASASDAIDVSLASRIAVAAQGRAIVRDAPLFGTGLGSWLHAYRPHQAPPVEGGIWDHAHNDYLELAAESGFAGIAVALLFVIAVVRAIRRLRMAERADGGRARRRHRDGGERPPGFETPEWRAALVERSLLRWGLAGGVAAILVHSVVEFGLRMPANLLTLLVIVALLLMSDRPRRSEGSEGVTSAPAWQVAGSAGRTARRSPALAVLLASVVAVAVPRVMNSLSILAGRPPLSPRDCLEAADVTLAEDGEDVRPQAIALVRRALDRSPADREAHEMLATALGSGPDSDEALRRAIALEPWSPHVRDRLALDLWRRGRREEAAREIDEATFRFPYLVSHAYLSTESALAPRGTTQLLRALTDGNTLVVRLMGLEPEMADAIERGLGRALDATTAGEARAAILNDLVTLLEVRERWAAAASLLRAEAARGLEGGVYLARAAHDSLEAQDSAAAERSLLAALVHMPERGGLYRELAVDVYAARGDFESAATVLEAGERNAIDMLPVYRGVVELLARRETARQESLVAPVSLRRETVGEGAEP